MIGLEVWLIYKTTIKDFSVLTHHAIKIGTVLVNFWDDKSAPNTKKILSNWEPDQFKEWGLCPRFSSCLVTELTQMIKAWDQPLCGQGQLLFICFLCLRLTPGHQMSCTGWVSFLPLNYTPALGIWSEDLNRHQNLPQTQYFCPHIPSTELMNTLPYPLGTVVWGFVFKLGVIRIY